MLPKMKFLSELQTLPVGHIKWSNALQKLRRSLVQQNGKRLKSNIYLNEFDADDFREPGEGVLTQLKGEFRSVSTPLAL